MSAHPHRNISSPDPGERQNLILNYIDTEFLAQYTPTIKESVPRRHNF
jgi:hypothetical protein